MGKEYSKEEVIITQAGNSGGQTDTVSGRPQWTELSAGGICGIIAICALVFIFAHFLYKKFRASLKSTIRAEVSKSMELLRV